MAAPFSPIACSLCSRVYDIAMGFEGCTQGYGCAVFVGEDHLYGTYGSVLFDMMSLYFTTPRRPEQFVPESVVCDWCVYQFVKSGLIFDPLEDDNGLPVRTGVSSILPNNFESFARLRAKTERTIREHLVVELRNLFPDREPSFMAMTKSLAIARLHKTFSTFLFQLDNGFLYLYSGRSHKMTQLTGREQPPTDQTTQDVDKVKTFLDEWPFWKYYTILRNNLLPPRNCCDDCDEYDIYQRPRF
jgi:hypothetical protein